VLLGLALARVCLPEPTLPLPPTAPVPVRGLLRLVARSLALNPGDAACFGGLMFNAFEVMLAELEAMDNRGRNVSKAHLVNERRRVRVNNLEEDGYL
jgi:hypothetical protein